MRPDDLAAAQLTPAQRRLLQALVASNLREATYLTGGTALAGFYLHHRESDDLDLFSDDEVPLLAIEELLHGVAGLSIRSYQRLYDRKIFVAELAGEVLKVEVTRYPSARQHALEEAVPGLRIDPPAEIMVNKLHALADRIEIKDLVDLYFLLDVAGLPSLPDAIAAAERKFGVAGLRYALQTRLLVPPRSLPPTRPTVSEAEVAARLRAEVEKLVAASIEG